MKSFEQNLNPQAYFMLTLARFSKKRILLSCLIVGVFATIGPAKAQDVFEQNDKKIHTTISTALAAGAYVTFRNKRYGRWASFISSFALITTIGTIKEIGDSRPDPLDLQANVIGAAAGPLLFLSFDW